MAAPHIPNLNTLRTSRENARNRGRGRGSSGRASILSSEEDKAAKDKIVQLTDEDASRSRLSAVEVGYLDDPFAPFFVPSKGQRRFPIINRGTYVRTTAIDNLIHLFLSRCPSQRKQIISLGAGSDTRFFRLTATTPGLPLIYHELDFPTNTASKIATIRHSPTLINHIPGPLIIPPAANSLSSPTYNIHPCDLRLLPSSPPLPNINPSLPTLLLSECCLCYLPPSTADAVATHFTQTLFPPSTPLALILYEPINPHDDAFGKVMVANLAARGIELQTLRQYSTLEAQRARLARYGFHGGGGGGGQGSGGGAEASDVDALWEGGVSAAEKERVAALEMVDEVEEWRLLAAHYCVAWGWREGDVGVGGGVGGGSEGEGEGEGTEAREGDMECGDGEGLSGREKGGIWEGWRGV